MRSYFQPFAMHTAHPWEWPILYAFGSYIRDFSHDINSYVWGRVTHGQEV